MIAAQKHPVKTVFRDNGTGKCRNYKHSREFVPCEEIDPVFNLRLNTVFTLLVNAVNVRRRDRISLIKTGDPVAVSENDTARALFDAADGKKKIV